MPATRIVILGGGFGGAYCARTLQSALRGLDAEVLLVDRHNYFVFTPLLVEAGTGSLEPRHAVVPLRDFLRTTAFRMGTVAAIDVGARTVSLIPPGGGDAAAIPFDHLVLALGSVTMMPPIPGLREHAFEMKSLADSVGLRDRCIQLLEEANAIDDVAERHARLHLVVVGASFTGVEVAGEFDVFLREAAKHYPRVLPRECRVTLVERTGRVLRALDEDLANYAVAQMRRRGIEVRLSTQVREVHADRVVLEDGTTLGTHSVVWCAGIEPNPLLAATGVPLDKRGYVRTGTDLRVEGRENIWAIGDCASVPDAAGTPYPATAQHAVRQGAHLARNIARLLRRMPLLPCNLTNQGAIAALGCRTGVARIFGIKLSGFAAWFLWRSVYLMKMPTLSRKVRVALDWTVDMFFPRDVVQLGLHRGRGR